MKIKLKRAYTQIVLRDYLIDAYAGSLGSDLESDKIDWDDVISNMVYSAYRSRCEEKAMAEVAELKKLCKGFLSGDVSPEEFVNSVME